MFPAARTGSAGGCRSRGRGWCRSWVLLGGCGAGLGGGSWCPPVVAGRAPRAGGLPGGRAALGAGEAEADGAGQALEGVVRGVRKVIVTRRLSALPVVSAVRLPRAGVLPMTGREARTVDRVRWSGRCRCSPSARCRPRSRRPSTRRPQLQAHGGVGVELAGGGRGVVRPMPARAWSPVLLEGDRAADGVAGHQAGRGDREPVPAPAGADVDLHGARGDRALAEVVEVNVPNVPRPATLAAAPRRTVEARTLPPVLVRVMRMTGSLETEWSCRGGRPDDDNSGAVVSSAPRAARSRCADRSRGRTSRKAQDRLLAAVRRLRGARGRGRLGPAVSGTGCGCGWSAR